MRDMRDEIDAAVEKLATTGLAPWGQADVSAIFDVNRTAPMPARQYTFQSMRECDPFAVLVARLCTHFYGVPDAESLLDIHADSIETDEYAKAKALADVLRGFVGMESSDPRWLKLLEG